jgi:hypothetical protein
VRQKKIWLTRKQLDEAGACHVFLQRFSKCFPRHKVEMTIANAERYALFFKSRTMWKPNKFLTPGSVELLTTFLQECSATDGGAIFASFSGVGEGDCDCRRDSVCHALLQGPEMISP